MQLLARLHTVYGPVLLCSLASVTLSSSVILHDRHAGVFTHAGQAMISCHLQSNYRSTVTLHSRLVIIITVVLASIVHACSILITRTICRTPRIYTETVSCNLKLLTHKLLTDMLQNLLQIKFNVCSK